MLDTSIHIGIRDSRRLHGQTTATDSDVWRLAKYDDGIAHASWDIDIWPGDSYDNPAVPRRKADYQERAKAINSGDYFDIRYGCIVAADIENMLMAGRCVSAEREAQASLRIQQTCMSTGEAAGVAAALSLREDTTPRELDPQIVVGQLEKDRDVEPAFPELRNLPFAG